MRARPFARALAALRARAGRSRLGLPRGYQTGRLDPSAVPPEAGHLPDVGPLARFIAERAGLGQVVRVVHRPGAAPPPLAGGSEACAAADLSRGLPPWPERTLAQSVLVVASALERLADPGPLLRSLADCARRCPYLLVATPDRDRLRGPSDLGPPGTPGRLQEWNLAEFARLLARHGVATEFVGYTADDDSDRRKNALLALLGTEVAFARRKAVKACAIVHAYNEADVVEECLDHLVSEGLEVILVDNWSTDRTYEKALSFSRSSSRIEVHRFPERPTGEYQWRLQLEETVRLAEASDHDWILHNDADEFRHAPFRNVRLAEALAFVSALGYSAVDFTVLDFRYLKDGQPSTGSFRRDLTFFEFGRRPGHFLQVKGWRNQPKGAVDLAASGGHEARFAGRRIFPLKFLLRHYPLRSEEQARRKVLSDRLPRSEAERRERGWHVQYLEFDEERFKGWDKDLLIPYSEESFAADYLVERTSGIGLGGEVERGPPEAGPADPFPA